MKVAPWHVVVVMLSGWIHRKQQMVIDYLKEENKVLREQLGGGRIWFTDDQRRRLAAKGRDLWRWLAAVLPPESRMNRGDRVSGKHGIRMGYEAHRLASHGTAWFRGLWTGIQIF